MIIESIKIASFGRLHNYSCTFGDRMNVIEGNNESGKSTLAAFIRYMLYGFPGRISGAELAEKKKRIRWQDATASGSMVIRVGDKRYRLERSTTATTDARERETYREVSSIIDLADNSVVFGSAIPGELFLGVPEQVFVSTAFVGQVGSPRVSADVNEAIENLLFSGNEDLNVQRALDKLDALRRTILYKNGKGGELFDMAARERELEERLAVAREKNAAILRHEHELSELSDSLSDLESELTAATAEEREARCMILCRAYDRLHEEERKLAEAEAALHDMEGFPAYLLRNADLNDLRVACATAEAAAKRAEEAAETRTKLEDASPVTEEETLLLDRVGNDGGTEKLRGDQTRAGRGARTGSVLLALALFFLLGTGVALLIAPTLLGGPFVYIFGGVWLVTAVLLGTGLALFLPAFFLLRRLYASYGVRGHAAFEACLSDVEEKQNALAAYQSELAAARATEASMRTDSIRTASELDTVVRRFGSRLPQEEPFPFVAQLLIDAARVLENKKEFESAAEKSKETIEALRLHLGDSKEEDIRAAVPADKEIELRDPEQLQARIRALREEERALESRRRELEQALAAARSVAEDPAALSDQLDELRTEMDALREQYEACLLAYEAIAGAGERLRRNISPHLASFAGRMMDHLTDGRYTEVGINAELEMALQAEDASRDLAYMSAGTQDLAYLSLRMALVDLLYRKEKPPVCFDESFVYQDSERAAHMLDALLVLAEEGQQTFVFTCHSRERELACDIDGERVTCITMPS